MNQFRNPYVPPLADVADAQPEIGAETLIENGRRVPAGNGVQWMTNAFRLFFQAPWKWIGVMLLLFLLSIVVAIIPFASLLTTILYPVIGGGVMYAIRQQRTTGSFTVGNVFAGFGPRFAPLAIVGLTIMLTYPLLFISFGVILGSDIAAMLTTGGEGFDPAMMGGLGMKFVLALLVYLLLALPLMAATYLAPALIMLHDTKAGAAMKMSFVGMIKNILPGIVFGLVMMGVFILSVIPLGLGLFVTIPVAIIATYTIYHDIYIEEQ